MNQEIIFTWHGTAFPAPRMTRSDAWNQRKCVTEYHAFKDSIRLAARSHGITADMQIERMDAIIYLPVPKSMSAARLAGKPHRKKPDVDNLVKGILDALNPEGDQGCWSIAADKRYDDGNGPRIELRLSLE